MNTKNILIIIIISVIGAFVLFAMLLIITIIIYTGLNKNSAIPSPNPPGLIQVKPISAPQPPNIDRQQFLKMAHRNAAQAILRTLESSYAMYQADTGNIASKFSDFVYIDKRTNLNAVPIGGFNKYTYRPITQNDLDKNSFEFIFNESNLKATYYLNGSDITVDIRE